MTDRHLLKQHFDPKAIERDVYSQWEGQGHFEPKGNGTPYSIAIPPPNVTGTLHIGHAFQMTIMDALIRFHRMDGRETLWQTGTDHAGISTQMVVTEQLLSQGIKPEQLGRDGFVERVWDWRRESGGTISQQMRRLGTSVDWSRERFTMDEGFSRAVIEVFNELYQDGLIYRGKRLVNWDPKLRTALSDLEVVSEEEDGFLWHIRYPLNGNELTADGKNHLVVATTRPETMLGDTAVAVHPDDPRYQSLIGKSCVLPIVDRELPIVADAHVDPEFGTGCLKITPAHDFDDNEIGQRHGLPLINIFTDDAKLNDNAPTEYRGKDRFEARKQIVSDLDAAGLIESIDPYKVQIPRGERSNVVVEPYMTDQWFVKIQPLADPAIEAVANGSITFEPDRWKNVYFSWMRNIKDWCISRQQWWGHRIPAWYDSDGNIFVGRNEEDARKRNGLSADIQLTQDPDVLETWFSSALWTFGTLGWPDQTRDFEKFHPTDVLVTGHDIIFFWVARMIMMTLRFTGQIPFKKVFITGLVRDSRGEKMSKTKGNGLDPIDLIDGIDLESLQAKRTQHLTQPRMAKEISARTQKEFPKGIPAYGTDAVRFTLCSIASPSSNYNLNLQRVEGHHFFCNKLWNAARFVLSNMPAEGDSGPATDTMADRWIKSRLNQLVKDCRLAFDTYRFDLLATHIYQFVWHEYCDWYVEITKTLFFEADASKGEVRAAQGTLLSVLKTVLKVLHPVMPFITEAIWQQLVQREIAREDSIMIQEYPAFYASDHDAEAERTLAWVQGVVTGIRNIRGERRVPPKNKVRVFLGGGTSNDRVIATNADAILKRLGKVESVSWLEDGDKEVVGSSQLYEHLTITVPFDSAEEVEQERQRLVGELKSLGNELDKVTNKLANENFVKRAPEDVVSAQRQKHETLTTQIDSLNRQLDSLPAEL